MITFFDPGQPLSAFDSGQLRSVMELGVYLIVNEYENELFQKLAEVSFDEMVDAFVGVVVTQGENGSTLYLSDNIVHVEAFPVDQIVDPTGCGDAYRGGLLW
ncbi:MAG: PfkB family carbohydrate kinase [bacterium]|nr:PfkB family carbohydrate kinase [bacterium]